MKIGIVGKSRYIDVDKFAEAICNFQQIDEDAANAMSWLLRTFPAADVVEVVRCKGCVHKGDAFCMAGDFPLTPENENCYCSYGERIEQ